MYRKELIMEYRVLTISRDGEIMNTDVTDLDFSHIDSGKVIMELDGLFLGDVRVDMDLVDDSRPLILPVRLLHSDVDEVPFEETIYYNAKVIIDGEVRTAIWRGVLENFFDSI